MFDLFLDFIFLIAIFYMACIFGYGFFDTIRNLKKKKFQSETDFKILENDLRIRYELLKEWKEEAERVKNAQTVTYNFFMDIEQEDGDLETVKIHAKIFTDDGGDKFLAAVTNKGSLVEWSPRFYLH